MIRKIQSKLKQELLTIGLVKDVLSYNHDTGLWTWIKRIGKKIKVGSIAGKVGSNGYIHIGLYGKSYTAHRLAWFYMTGKWPEEFIDHINRIRNDNRWCNLREVNHSNNMRNIIARSNTGLKGIVLRYGKYVTQIQLDGKNIHLGIFDTLESAAYVYKAAELKYLNPNYSVASDYILGIM